ncbi:MAG: 2-amino-4-hydroxy-6-hydroxymethyldihydropteridine diphosphokinase [Cyanobium sp.]
MSHGPLQPPVAVALGANLGDPLATLPVVRPLLAELLRQWWREPQEPAGSELRLRWSPLFRTAPVGGPANQPPYLNAVVVADGGPARAPADPPPLQRNPQAGQRQAAAAADLLERLLALERRFGRVRAERWGPRSLDLDLLWCGAAPVEQLGLCLPHPRLRERAFVLAPLVAIDPRLIVPGDGVRLAAPAAALLAVLPPQALLPPPERLTGREGWPE